MNPTLVDATTKTIPSPSGAGIEATTDCFPQFLSLPFELRRMIYSFAMEDDVSASGITTPFRFDRDSNTATEKRSYDYERFVRANTTRDEYGNDIMGPLYVSLLPKLVQTSRQVYFEAGTVFIEISHLYLDSEYLQQPWPKITKFLRSFPGNTGFQAVRHLRISCYGYDRLFRHFLPLLPGESPIAVMCPGLKTLDLMILADTFVETDQAKGLVLVPISTWIEKQKWERLFSCRKLRKLILRVKLADNLPLGA